MILSIKMKWYFKNNSHMAQNAISKMWLQGQSLLLNTVNLFCTNLDFFLVLAATR